MSVGDQYREKRGTVEAFQYDGTFPLSFLRADESVASAGSGSNAATVTTPHGSPQTVSRGDFVLREYRSGRLCVLSARRFLDAYEPITQDEPRCCECGGASR